MEFLTFEITGTSKGTAQAGRPAQQTGTSDKQPDTALDPEAEIVRKLNERADEIASTIEREIRRLLALTGGVSVQADLSFSKGNSIVLEGTVALLFWIGGTALDPIRQELAKVIQTATRRVLNRTISAVAQNMSGLPVDVFPTFVGKEPEVGPSSAQGRVSWMPQGQTWLFILISLLILVVVGLVVEQLTTSSVPRTVYFTLPPPQQNPPQQASPPQGGKGA